MLVADPDWDSLVIDSPDRDLTRRILHAITDGVPNGHCGRELYGLFRAAGLQDVTVDPAEARRALDTGVAFRAEGDNARAIAELTRAIELGESSGEVYLERGRARLESGNAAEARRQMEACAEAVAISYGAKSALRAAARERCEELKSGG